MPDYKTMYFKLFCAMEDAKDILSQAQRLCEDMYICSEDERDEDGQCSWENSPAIQTEDLAH